MKYRNKNEIERLNDIFTEVGFPKTIPPPPTVHRKKKQTFRISAVCGKTIYPTEADARKVITTRKRHGAPDLRFYKCEVCVGFHLTSAIGKQHK